MTTPPKTAPSGRVVLVTGAAKGIGWAISQRFAAAGDRVVLADIDETLASSRAASLGEDHLALSVDVADADSVKAMIAACLDQAGGLDVLVNNAGILESVAAPFVDQTIEDAARVLAVNVSGTALAAEAAAEHFRTRRSGAIVNLASCGGLFAVPARAAYGSSKAAIAGLTRSMAVAWAPFGIRVNSVAPGYILTEMSQGLIDSGKLDVGALSRRVPLGRMAASSEMAEVIFHLASEDAGFVTGVNVIADGGLMAYGGLADASTGKAPGPRPGRRTVMVVGAGGAAGRAAARRFAALGDRVIALDADPRQAELSLQGLAGDHVALTFEPGNAASLRGAVTAALETAGPLDVLINSPEAWPGKPGQTSPNYLLETLSLTKAVGTGLAPGAAIVLLAPSEPTHHGQAAQSGVLMLTRALACEWASSGVRVNAVIYDRADQGPTPPLGRSVRAEDIAAVVDFLASPAASYVNGATIPVDGGRGAALGWISPY